MVSEGNQNLCQYYGKRKISSTCRFFNKEAGSLCVSEPAKQNADSKIQKQENQKKTIGFNIAEIRDEFNRNARPSTVLADVGKELRSEEAYNEFLKRQYKRDIVLRD